MSTQEAINRLDRITEERPHSPASTKVTLTLGEVREIKARIAWLTDTVVMAAALWFDQIADKREADYASESLHELAADLVNETPRLKGAFKAEI